MRKHLTYANVAATLALFLALSGGIALALERNRVLSRHIANGEVRSADVANDGSGFALVGGDINEAALGVPYAVKATEPRDLDTLMSCSSQDVSYPEESTPLAFTAEDYDTANMHVEDPDCNDPQRSRVTIPADGLYEIVGHLDWSYGEASDSSGWRRLSVRKNGGQEIEAVRQADSGAASTQQEIVAMAKLQGGDYLELLAADDDPNGGIGAITKASLAVHFEGALPAG